MASVDSSVMDFWLAYDEQHPLNENRENWMKHAMVMHELRMMRATQAAAAGAQPEPFAFNDYLPERYHVQSLPQSTRQHEAALEKGFGV